MIIRATLQISPRIRKLGRPPDAHYLDRRLWHHHRHLTPMPPAEPKIPLTVYLPAALRREVEHQAADAGQTLSTNVERALVSYIKAPGGSCVLAVVKDRRELF